MLKKIKNTGERMVPEYEQGNLIYAEHMTRYLAAKAFVSGKIVLDIASGSGYGTKILADDSKHVYGVEIDPDAVAYSVEHFDAPNIDFIVGSANKIPLDDDSVDVVVTFETIEHVEDYKTYIDEVDRVLRPDGVLLISTPNDLEFPEGNHFHLHEFQYSELIDLLKPKFKHIESYYQATYKAVVIGSADIISTEAHLPIVTYNFSPTDPKKYLYFYLVCSRKPILEKINPIVALGQHYSDRDVLAAWKESNDYSESIRQEVEDEVIKLKHELHEIKASRVNRLAQRMSDIIQTFKRQR